MTRNIHTICLLVLPILALAWSFKVSAGYDNEDIYTLVNMNWQDQGQACNVIWNIEYSEILLNELSAYRSEPDSHYLKKKLLDLEKRRSDLNKYLTSSNRSTWNGYSTENTARIARDPESAINKNYSKCITDINQGMGFVSGKDHPEECLSKRYNDDKQNCLPQRNLERAAYFISTTCKQSEICNRLVSGRINYIKSSVKYNKTQAEKIEDMQPVEQDMSGYKEIIKNDLRARAFQCGTRWTIGAYEALTNAYMEYYHDMENRHGRETLEQPQNFGKRNWQATTKEPLQRLEDHRKAVGEYIKNYNSHTRISQLLKEVDNEIEHFLSEESLLHIRRSGMDFTIDDRIKNKLREARFNKNSALNQGLFGCVNRYAEGMGFVLANNNRNQFSRDRTMGNTYTGDALYKACITIHDFKSVTEKDYPYTLTEHVAENCHLPDSHISQALSYTDEECGKSYACVVTRAVKSKQIPPLSRISFGQNRLASFARQVEEDKKTNIGYLKASEKMARALESCEAGWKQRENTYLIGKLKNRRAKAIAAGIAEGDERIVSIDRAIQQVTSRGTVPQHYTPRELQGHIEFFDKINFNQFGTELSGVDFLGTNLLVHTYAEPAGSFSQFNYERRLQCYERLVNEMGFVSRNREQCQLFPMANYFKGSRGEHVYVGGVKKNLVQEDIMRGYGGQYTNRHIPIEVVNSHCHLPKENLATAMAYKTPECEANGTCMLWKPPGEEQPETIVVEKPVEDVTTEPVREDIVALWDKRHQEWLKSFDYLFAPDTRQDLLDLESQIPPVAQHLLYGIEGALRTAADAVRFLDRTNKEMIIGLDWYAKNTAGINWLYEQYSDDANNFFKSVKENWKEGKYATSFAIGAWEIMKGTVSNGIGRIGADKLSDMVKLCGDNCHLLSTIILSIPADLVTNSDSLRKGRDLLIDEVIEFITPQFEIMQPDPYKRILASGL